MWSASLRGKQLEQDSTVNKVYKLIKIKKVDINLVILETQNSYIRAWNDYNCPVLAYLLSRHKQVKHHPHPCAQQEY